MRALLREGDLVCVEVQKINNDGLLRLTARSTKYGKVSMCLSIFVDVCFKLFLYIIRT